MSDFSDGMMGGMTAGELARMERDRPWEREDCEESDGEDETTTGERNHGSERSIEIARSTD